MHWDKQAIALDCLVLVFLIVDICYLTEYLLRRGRASKPINRT
jgi:hypothetical protein